MSFIASTAVRMLSPATRELVENMTTCSCSTTDIWGSRPSCTAGVVKLASEEQQWQTQRQKNLRRSYLDVQSPHRIQTCPLSCAPIHQDARGVSGQDAHGVYGQGIHVLRLRCGTRLRKHVSVSQKDKHMVLEARLRCALRMFAFEADVRSYSVGLFATAIVSQVGCKVTVRLLPGQRLQQSWC